MINILTLVGAKVRDIRKQKGLSQEQLGERSGFQFSYIGSLERGEANISLKNLDKIADGLEVNIHELFSFSTELTHSNINKEPYLIEIIELLLKLEVPDLKKVNVILNEIFN
ncbi:helix-turn-helix domain-containing protein [Paenibacillus sp. LMG 31461]|uniref:Helix-turn-helix domain-containing protein n=1 Tax=Paenibacillus plantarum TaxID=2654975 RepID=A0ABX1X8S7_9BACL|nr:helix-turn-helix transcriptional regulator [Paenibacillus plantarum]NOU64727.1 helix-turn-helix domain-containing protein [Paenibacillus plantarum]